MGKFSNEPKERKEKRKAIAKTVLKRYSFIVWLPILIFILNWVGESASNILWGPPLKPDIWWLRIFEMIGVTMFGGFTIIVCILVGIMIILVLSVIWEYLKKGTILEDIKSTIFFIGEGLKESFMYIVKIPIRICRRIKSEPQRFKDALQRELEKEE